MLLQGDNRLVRSDTGSWLRGVLGGMDDVLPGNEAIAHPAALVFWRPVGRLMTPAVRALRVGQDAKSFAGRALVAAVASLGVGSLVLAASTLDVSGVRLWLLFTLCLLSTANVIVALPEYFGLSHGLLSMFSAGCVLWSRSWGRYALPLLAVVIIGTTVTNGIYVAIVAAVRWISSRRLRVAVLLAIIVSPPLALLAVERMPPASLRAGNAPGFVFDLQAYARRFSNWHVTARPDLLVEQAALSLVYPIAAPPESLRLSARRNEVRFRSYRLRHYTGLGLLAVLGWTALLAGSLAKATGSDRQSYLQALSAWIAFNVVFHSVWGDEHFLYAPHWSWALFSVVVLGAGRLPAAFVAAAALAVVPAQIQVLMALKDLVARVQ